MGISARSKTYELLETLSEHLRCAIATTAIRLDVEVAVNRVLMPLVRLQSSLASVPAIIYLIIYILMVPAFAYYYKGIANQFFHATSKYEASIILDGNQIRAEIESLIVSQFIEVNGEPVDRFEDWNVDIREFKIDRAWFDDGRLHFRTYMRFFSDSGVMIGGPRNFSISVNPNFAVGFPGSSDRKFIKFPTSNEANDWPVADRAVFRTSPKGIVSRDGALVFDAELQDRLTSLRDGFRGFPAKSTGSFWRLFYFSAVTQTTLGFGDIVPISNSTRLAVSIQSILGIVIIGHFLNSLAQPMASNSDSRPKRGDDREKTS